MTDDASGTDRDGDDDSATSSAPDVPRSDSGPDTSWHPDTRPITADETAEDAPFDDDGPADDERAGSVTDRIQIDLGGAPTDDNEGTADDDPNAPEPSSAPIESGDPDLEHVLFVVLGAIAMVLVLVQLVSIPL